MLKIYHNPRCAKSRAGLNFLKDHQLEFEIYEYLKEGLTPNIVAELAKLTQLKVTDLVRTQEDYYKKNLKGNTYTDDEWCTIIAENPKLLQRPIVIKNNKGVLAQPADKINTLL